MLLLCFAAVLLAAVLLSNLADRTILSTSALFLVAGLLLGEGGLNLLGHLKGDTVGQLAELALFAVLFTDGMKAGWRDLRRAWRLPGRALLLGLPLTLLFTALLAKLFTGLGWWECLLIGAILSPTDPVFASALVGNKRVPHRLRHLLNVESGVNDGLALPFVIILLAVARDDHHVHAAEVVTELLIGVAIGVVVPLVALALERHHKLAASHQYEPLFAAAIGLLVLALGKATHGNLFLAAFAAGITVASVGPRQQERFEEFGELVSELLKLVSLLVFGGLITLATLRDIGWLGALFALLALLLPRPLALAVSFVRSGLGRREQLVAMWFGPKGFASVVYALYVLSSGLRSAQLVFDVVAITVVLSILLHSSTDVVIARGFDQDGDGVMDETPPDYRDERPGSHAAL